MGILFDVPCGACDCHMHIDDARFPLPPDAAVRQRILVDNPARLYGF